MAAPGGILLAGRTSADVGVRLAGAGPLMLVRGMAKKKGGRVKDRRVRMSPPPVDIYDHKTQISSHPVYTPQC